MAGAEAPAGVVPCSILNSYVPIPVSVTGCGLPPPSSRILTTAFRAPAAVGVNIAVIVQLAPAVMLTPQLLVCEKSPTSPVIVIPEKFKGAIPTFVKVTVWGALVVPTAWLPKGTCV